MLIEHAIYTSSLTSGNEGYQIIAASPGIRDPERSQLALWCPSHDGLLPEFIVSGSVSFFQLAEGQYWITQTSTAGTEYSDRGGYRLVTHCLRIPENILTKFANNPFSILDAIVAGGYLEIDFDAEMPCDIESFPLVGRARAFDPHRLREWTQSIEHQYLLDVLDRCCSADRLAFVGGAEILGRLAALFHLLPVATRRQISFCTGQRPVAARKFLWNSAPDDVHLLRRWQLDGIQIIDSPEGKLGLSKMGASQSNNSKHHGWTAFIDHCLNHPSRLDLLKSAIESSTAPQDLKKLNGFGNQLVATVPS